jgi:hypothetical protein
MALRTPINVKAIAILPGKSEGNLEFLFLRKNLMPFTSVLMLSKFHGLVTRLISCR